MNASDPVDLAEVAKSKAASHEIGINEKNPTIDEITVDNAAHGDTYAVDDIDKTLPTNDELANLRRVAGKIPWAAYTIAFVELCERFSYYGTTAVCKKIPPPTPRGIFANNLSRQLYPTPASSRFNHGRTRRWNLRFQQRYPRSSRNGPTGLDRFDTL
jgi:POT family proton-dependent oligopeptide transporter